MEMPHVDGNYLIDWIGPKLETLELIPQVIVISAMKIESDQKHPAVLGYINKARLENAEKFEEELVALLDP